MLLAAVILVSCGSSKKVERWYSAELVAQGGMVFKLNCAVCHGAKAQSTPIWEIPDKNGLFPPPPLDGSAHSWHHQLPMLRMIIREGGAKFNGKMPAFKKSLSTEEIDAVIAWFQSLWSDEIYTRWSGTGVIRVPLPDILKDLQQ